MLLDWSNPPELDAPAYRARRVRVADRDRLGWAGKKRAGAKKNHSENRERALLAKAKAADAAKRAARNIETLQAYRAEVRRYWAGERDNHPSLTV